MFNAYILNDWATLQEAYNALSDNKLVGTHVSNYLFAFLDGLVGVYLFRNHHRRRRYLTSASRSMGMIERAVSRGSNFSGMWLLLQAEKASLKRGMDCRSLYDKAIATLGRNGFTHFAAIANERAGDHMLRCGDSEWAEFYLAQAAALYAEWGATVKVGDLKTKYGFIEERLNASSNGGTDLHSSIRNLSVLGRSKFNQDIDKIDNDAIQHFLMLSDDCEKPSPPLRDVDPHVADDGHTFKSLARS